MILQLFKKISSSSHSFRLSASLTQFWQDKLQWSFWRKTNTAHFMSGLRADDKKLPRNQKKNLVSTVIAHIQQKNPRACNILKRNYYAQEISSISLSLSWMCSTYLRIIMYVDISSYTYFSQGNQKKMPAEKVMVLQYFNIKFQ